MKRNHYTALGLVLACAVSLALTGCGTAAAAAVPEAKITAGTAAAAASAAPVREVTVTASGTVKLVPDKASLTFGVTTKEKTADAAQKKNSEDVNRVISVLTGRGIEEKSIRTTDYSMYPQYDHTGNGEQQITGYIVRTSLTIQDQDISEVGKLIADCVAAGINNVDNISFLCSGYDEAYKEALSQAVKTSREKAEALAAAAGKTLGDPVTISEGYQDTSARYAKNANAAFDTIEQAAAMGPALMPGETSITANVTVTYEMQ